MSFFSWRRKSLNISEEDPAYKVRYLGNIHTCMMKGDGCVDKPASILWNNYLQSSHQALDMKIVVSVSGIKAYTKEQGLMQYWSHKISYIIAHPEYPRMFLWVYRHEGRKMKLDLRCHAVLCKSETKAKLLDVQLHEKLSFALKEFVRDKRRKYNSRLIFEKTNSELTNGSILPLRQQMLSQGGKFKPPVSKMNSAPKLGSIFELDEKEEERKKEYDLLEEEEQEEEEEEEETEEKQVTNSNICADPKSDLKEVECEEDEEEGLGGMNDSIDDEDDDGNDADDDFCTESDVSDGIDSLALDPESDNVSVSSDHVCQTDGLKQDDMDFLLSKPKKSDSDGESSESGFSDSSKEIGLYRVDDGDRLHEERDDVGLGSNDCCPMQCDKVTNCHNDDSFDGDNEDDGFERSSSINSSSSGDSVSNSHNNSNSNNNKHTSNSVLDSSTKEHIHLENTTTTTTTTTLQEINENNNKITNQSTKNNDNNNNNSSSNNNNSLITESLNSSSSSTSSSESSSSTSSSSLKSSLVSSSYNSNSSTLSPSSSLPSPVVSSNTTEGAKKVQFL